MTPWPIGISTGCFYHRSIFEVLEPIRDSGFVELEICSYPHHLDYHHEELVQKAGDHLQKLGLRAFSFHAPFAPQIDITSLDSAVRAASVKELKVACRAASLMQARHVVLHPGPESAGRPPPDEFDLRMANAAQSLNQVACYCQEIGIHLLLENMLPHLLFGRVSDMLYLLGEIQHCTVGTCLDTGHAHLSGDLPTVIHKLSGHLQMLHINDNRADWDAHLVPGQGTIDWTALIRDLQTHHFQGGLILELSGRSGEPVSEALDRAHQGREFLVHAMKEWRDQI
ncbi:sugar phosphate isomerase/epimerase family protein [Phragmitibacter flavus]|nr:sugar phosphate isomerase/epimerase family protein [Phragmitibacter flavus]